MNFFIPIVMKNTFAILLLTGIMSGCWSAPKSMRTDTASSGVAVIASDECYEGMVQQCINIFEADNHAASLLPMFMSETQAINMLLRDSIRFAVIARGLTEQEISAIKMRNPQLTPRVQKLAVDGIALIAHRSNPDTLISLQTIRDILTGKITSWQEVNPASRLGKIMTAFDNINSSTARYMRDSICNGAALSPNLYSLGGNQAALDYVMRTPNALGVIGVGWISNPYDSSDLALSQSVRVMAVSRMHPANAENSYKPYPAFLALRRYPLTRDVFLALTDLQGTLPAGFANFMLRERGQRIILKSGLVPARAPLRMIEVRQ
jgi:phosphate transport system substrate-binding protein